MVKEYLGICVSARIFSTADFFLHSQLFAGSFFDDWTIRAVNINGIDYWLISWRVFRQNQNPSY